MCVASLHNQIDRISSRIEITKRETFFLLSCKSKNKITLQYKCPQLLCSRDMLFIQEQQQQLYSIGQIFSIRQTQFNLLLSFDFRNQFNL